jgi:hypothetical protein
VLGPLERTNLNRWTGRIAFSKGPDKVDVSPSPLLKKETYPVSETLFSSYLEFRTMPKVHKPSDSEWYTSSEHLGYICYDIRVCKSKRIKWVEYVMRMLIRSLKC